jgi:hypothetical protein
MVPCGTEAARAFIPSMDFASSKAFYEALGSDTRGSYRHGKLSPRTHG